MNTIRCNISRTDAYIREFIASLFLIYAVYEQSYVFLALSIILFYTAFSRFCLLYKLFKINERFSKKNYYKSLLPHYNTSAVFIFDKKGNLVFKNDAANKEFENIQKTQDLQIANLDRIIQRDQNESIIFETPKKTYQIDIKGVSEENLLLAYVTDVTKVIELNDEIEATQREVIYTMGEIGETRSKETGNHVKRVAKYSHLLALKYGLSSQEAEILKIASPMHDIGKVGIPDEILKKPAKLTPQEFEIMKTHATLGYNMLKNSTKPILQAAAIVAYQHHEKWDGSGYPQGLKEEEIHIFGRITAVADVFDALSSDRIYKKAWELEAVLRFFKEQKGKHFDPKLVELLLENLDEILAIRDKYRDIEIHI